MSIDVKQAVGIALKFADDMFANDRIIDARLEEVERAECESKWLVTLSFVREPVKASEAFAAPTREYKIFAIQVQTGDVEWMKIRQPV
ncbi:MAG: hypothetical protein HQ567_23120 [Candidatus Nealsonbacteria bacterium]|nr:hypothetical protein [Candidatus Nealsonbacteria bacterium]